MAKKFFVLFFVMLVAAFVFAGCGTDAPAPVEAPAPAPPAAGEAAAEPAEPGDDEAAEPTGDGPRTVIRFASLEDFTMIDPHYNTRAVDNTLAWQVFEGFHFVNVFGGLEPRLATHFEISDDMMTFTYFLKDGVEFHCGHTLSAADAVFSFERALEAPPMQAAVGSVETVRAVDDLTVEITLATVDPMFHLNGNIAIMCHICGADVEPGFFEPNIGTGPYFVTDWGDGTRVVKDRNENWHMQHELGWLPQIERQVRYVLLDLTTALMALEADDIDYLGIPPADWDRIVASGNFTTFTQQSWHTTYMVMNNQVYPFDNLLVRQAISYAINQHDVLLAAREGLADPAFMMGNPYYLTHLQNLTEDPGFNRFDFNPDRARELLAEAGYPDGLTVPGPLGTLGTVAHFVTAAEVIQAQLADVGIHATILSGDPATYFQDLNLGNFYFAISGWSWTTSDPFWTERRFSTYHISDVNMAHYSNPEVDALFRIAATTMDQEVRRQAFRDAYKIISHDAPLVNLYYQFTLLGWNPNLTADPNRPLFEWYWR